MRALTAPTALAGILALLFATEAAAQPARFDVISIRRNTSGTTQQSVNVTPAGVTFINFGLRPIGS